MFLLMTEPAINDCGLAVTNAPESPFILRMLYPFAPHSSPAFVKHIPNHGPFLNKLNCTPCFHLGHSFCLLKHSRKVVQDLMLQLLSFSLHTYFI